MEKDLYDERWILIFTRTVWAIVKYMIICGCMIYWNQKIYLLIVILTFVFIYKIENNFR